MTWALNMCMLAVMLLSSCCSESNFVCVVAPAGAHFKRGGSRSERAQDAPAQNLIWQHANTLQRLPPTMLVQLRGGQGDENEEGRRTRNEERLVTHSIEHGVLEETLFKGKGEGGQNDMAEDFLRQMPKGLSDWRHSFQASSRKKTFDVSSKFKRRFSFQERAAMAAKIAASGRVVPVIAERLHDGIQLPDTLKPKFSVPAALSLDKFVVILRQRLPWTDLYSRHSHIRLFVKEVIIHTCMHTYIHTCMHVCMNMHAYLCVCVCACVRVCGCGCGCGCGCVCVYFICMYIYIRMSVYMYVCMYARIHVRVYVWTGQGDGCGGNHGRAPLAAQERGRLPLSNVRRLMAPGCGQGRGHKRRAHT